MANQHFLGHRRCPHHHCPEPIHLTLLRDVYQPIQRALRRSHHHPQRSSERLAYRYGRDCVRVKCDHCTDSLVLAFPSLRSTAPIRLVRSLRDRQLALPLPLSILDPHRRVRDLATRQCGLGLEQRGMELADFTAIRLDQ